MPRWDRTKGRPEPIAALNKILERDNGEPLLHVEEFLPGIHYARPNVIPYARKTVLEMFAKASKSLPDGVFFSLVEAWRPIERQQRIYDFIYKCATEAFPARDHVALRRTVCRWVAPTDQKAPPGHCTGAALDVELVDAAGEALDVFSPFTRHRAARTYTLGLSEEAQRNRTALVEALLGAGFSNCRDEWWHYSYGDAGWAVRLGHDTCVYGLATLPLDLYEASEVEHAKTFIDRPNPFLV
jgi:zinc D-Ala-D-Ala dipeptidase